MTGDNKTILVVEDEHPVREMIGTVLNDEGYLTLLAEHGQQAVDILHTHAIDLVLSDISMPGMGGIELDNYCRQHFPATPFVLMSGSNGSSAHNGAGNHSQTGKTPGAARGVLKKPFALHELIQTVAGMFEE